MDPRERRLAENESLFREVNERVEAIASRHGDDDHVYEFYCECANTDCTMHVPATLAAYEAVRENGRRFLIVPEHALPEIETVVERHEEWWVIEKFGDGGAFAERLDPRSRTRA
jgi:hypothetical protein